MYTVNNRPARCPYGHPLGPKQMSLSWDMPTKTNWLICLACGRQTQLPLGVEGAVWLVLVDGDWEPFEG